MTEILPSLNVISFQSGEYTNLDVGSLGLLDRLGNGGVAMRFVILAAVFALLAPGLAGAQSGSALPRTEWGHPDLQGVWTNTTTTPLQRPAKFAGQSVLTEEEVAELERETVERNERLLLRPAQETTAGGNVGAYNSFWLDRGMPSEQTSLIVDPPDGRLPAATERVRERDAAMTASRNSAPDSWENMNLYDRCITRGLPGAMIPGFYNHNYQILQTPDHVAIVVEMIHDARIIPLGDRSHLSSEIGQWMGDSRGYWDGDTLVVETTNFSSKADERAMSANVYTMSAGKNLRLVERFTRVDADTIDYRFTFTDPTTYTTPWTASIPMRRLGGPLFEYACHEGNYGLQNILRGARAAERAGEGSGH